jgi:hypothetical protein
MIVNQKVTLKYNKSIMNHAMDSTIATFTQNTLEDILAQGGDYRWHLNPDRAKCCQFLLCVSSIGSNRRTGFLIGKVSGVVPDGDNGKGEDLYRINVSEVAIVKIPSIDFAFRNPVKYCHLKDFNIDPSALEFKPVAKQLQVELQPTSLSISDAKAALARYYDIKQECITITIAA